MEVIARIMNAPACNAAVALRHAVGRLPGWLRRQRPGTANSRRLSAAAVGLAAAACGLFAPAVQAARAEPADLVIGQTIALSGPISEHGQAVLQGIVAYVKQVNAEGGINGRKIVIDTLDDGGEGARAAENTRKLVARDAVLAVFGGVEGGPCVASMKVAVEAKVPFVACLAGSPELRENFNRYVFPLRPGHMSEFEKLIDTALQYGLQRIGFVHADTDTGRKHLGNVQRILAERKMELAAALPLTAPGQQKSDPQQLVDRIAAADLDIVFNHGSYAAYAAIVKEAKARGLRTQFMAVNSGAQQMVKLLGADAANLIFTQVVPFPWDSAPLVVKEYRDALKKSAPQAQPSFSGLEGYISAKVLVEGLRRMGKKPSREALVEGLQQLNRYDVGGFEVSYSRTSRQGSTFVDTVLATADGRFVH